LKTTHEIILGDSRNLEVVETDSVHLIITSPPYWNRKDYGHENQIGFGQTYDAFLSSLEIVIKELYRVLIPGRKLCIVVGDLYQDSKSNGRYKVISISSDIIKMCESLGFDYHGAIIWQKVCKTRPSGGVHGCFMGSYPNPPNGIVTLDYEFILLFKIPGPTPKISDEIRCQSKLTKNQWQKYFVGHWKIPGDKSNNHPATFPLEIPKRLIRMYSFVGETILDPFSGSGTTTLAARILKRNSIGCEISKDEYWPVIQEKVGFNQPGLFQDCEFKLREVANQK